MENSPKEDLSYPRVVGRMGTVKVLEVAPKEFRRTWFDRLNGVWKDVPSIPVRNATINEENE